MISYNEPTAVLLPNPAGIDKGIQDIQIKLVAKLPWLQVAFGRAFRQEGVIASQQGGRPRRYFFPEVYQEKGEPFNAMPNDNLKSSVFFYVQDPATPVNYNFLTNNFFSCTVSAVFWMNLDKIDPDKDFRYTETLKQDVLNVFRYITTAKITAVYDAWENVLSNFTVDGNARQYLKPPYTGFRIDFTLTYLETNGNCQ